MDKETTSVKRAGFSKGKPGRLGPKATARPYDPTVSLRNPAIIQKAILQSLKDGDFESVMEIYKSHLRVLNRTKTADSLQVSRQYIHKMSRAIFTGSAVLAILLVASQPSFGDTIRLCVDTYVPCTCPDGCSESYCEMPCKAINLIPPCTHHCRSCTCGAYGSLPGCKKSWLGMLADAFVSSAHAEDSVETQEVHKVGERRFVETPLGTMMIDDGVPADDVIQGTIGVQIGTIEGHVGITGVEKGSVAEKSGLEKGTIILSIDGRSTRGMKLSNAAAALKGKPGTMVVLRIRAGLLPWGKKVPLLREAHALEDDDRVVDGLKVEKVTLKELGKSMCPAHLRKDCFLVLSGKICQYVCRAEEE